MNDIYSSQSNSRLSNSSCQDDATSNDSFSSDYFIKRRKLNNSRVLVESDDEIENVELGEDNEDDNNDIEDEEEVQENETELEEIEQEIVEHLVELPHLIINPEEEEQYLDNIEEDFANDENNIITNNQNVTDNNDEDYFNLLPTPQKRREMHNYTPDSGIATAVCSSSGSVTISYEQNTPNPINISHILLNQKINRVRRNYRRRFENGDTDEDEDYGENGDATFDDDDSD